MKAIKIKDLKKGDLFVLRPLKNPEEEAPINIVWERGDYNRECKKYECSKYADICKYNWMRGDRIVYTDFIF